MADTVQGSSVRQPISVHCPSPPRNLPGPPESVRSSRRCWTIDVRVSIDSAATPATPLGNPVVLRPSLAARAPAPPHWNRLNVNRSADAAALPLQMEIHIGSAPGAISRSGIASASAPNTTPGRKWPIKCREATAAGSRQLRIDPGGAETWTGRKAPSLWGTSGLMAAFMANEA